MLLEFIKGEKFIQVTKQMFALFVSVQWVEYPYLCVKVGLRNICLQTYSFNQELVPTIFFPTASMVEHSSGDIWILVK